MISRTGVANPKEGGANFLLDLFSRKNCPKMNKNLAEKGIRAPLKRLEPIISNYRSDMANSNTVTVNSKFHLIQAFY